MKVKDLIKKLQDLNVPDKDVRFDYENCLIAIETCYNDETWDTVVIGEPDE
jgi:hypothetical protein